MTGVVNFFLSLIVVFPALICLIKYRRMQRNYRPFAVFAIGALLTELISFYLGWKFRTNTAFLNFYSLFESLILVYQFHRWGLLAKKKHLFLTVMVIMVALWGLDNFVLNRISENNKYYLIAYCFLLVMLSIGEINQDMMQGEKISDDSSRLIICIGFIVIFTFTFVREAFAVFNTGIGLDTEHRVFLVITIPNMISNILYAFGAYYIPKEQRWADTFSTYRRQK